MLGLGAAESALDSCSIFLGHDFRQAGHPPNDPRRSVSCSRARNRFQVVRSSVDKESAMTARITAFLATVVLCIGAGGAFALASVTSGGTTTQNAGKLDKAGKHCGD